MARDHAFARKREHVGAAPRLLALARTEACRLSERKRTKAEAPLGAAGPLVVGGIDVPLGVGTQTSNLGPEVRHSCPEAHCPEVHVHEPHRRAPKGNGNFNIIWCN